tara:strand:+ start:1895 stop:2758 length:864 start_codon:yes stop_codon:yes gene_type:complete
MKNTYNLVSDIYQLMETKEVAEGVDFDACVEKFGENVKELMRNEFGGKKRDGRKLRMSNIGREDRYLWNVYNDVEKSDDIQGHTYVKFLYGHLIEEMLLFLTKAAGHEVTDEQKKCEVNGITGSMDCKIDGIVTDVKSVSTYGFRKFKDGSLAYDDPFGYIGQIKGYAYAEGATKFGWLAMDKQNGHLTYLLYDSEDTQAPVHDLISYDIKERIDHVKKLVEQPTPPDVCYEPIADGKSGNRKLAVGCSYCAYKKECWPSVRAFAYSTGPRYLIEVHNEPKVQEITI